MTDTSLNQRYVRQLRLPFWDDSAQECIESSHVMIIGCGALGCPSADLLARAGVGKITLVDRDLVEYSNLHRQTLFSNVDALEQLPKAIAAKNRLSDVNPDINIQSLVADFNAYDAEQLVKHNDFGIPDVLVDGTDNFETRYLLNDISVMHNIPYVYGGAIGSRGMAAVFIPGKTPCLRCLFDSPPPAGSQPTCETSGVFSPVSSIIGAYQASETLKLLMNANDRVMGSMLEFDLWEGQRRRFELEDFRNPDCECCQHRNFAFLDRDDEETISICGRDAIQINPHSKSQVDMESLLKSLNVHGDFQQSPFMLKGTLYEQPVGITVFRDGRAIFDGIDDPSVARSLYARYIGN
ncbi:MAG: ThiF family adenylyltransferase [Phycisphaerales bacterium]|nr:ThiF family adenylyltransferase [Phycisphaerales bacterium]